MGGDGGFVSGDFAEYMHPIMRADGDAIPAGRGGIVPRPPLRKHHRSEKPETSGDAPRGQAGESIFYGV
jgi:hypothetical protein